MPTAITSLAQAAEALRAYWPKYNQRPLRTLEHMQHLMDFLGNPQDRLPVIHVAGTSGKTSTSYYAAALLRATGKHVGLAVSPHVYTLNERVQVDGEPLTEAVFCSSLETFLGLVEKSGVRPNYFELMLAFAYWEFARQGLDCAVIETSLGGLLDASNVVTREDKLCIITDIGLDHQDKLGTTLPEITAQKAGIIHLHNTVFCYQQAPEIMDVIHDAARRRQADLHVVGQADALPDFGTRLPLFQQRNLGLAVRAVRFWLERLGGTLPASAISAAAHVAVPGRMERLQVGNKIVVLDGAHNAQKMHSCVQSLQALYPGKPVATLLACKKDELPRAPALLRQLQPVTRHLIATEYNLPGFPYVAESASGVRALALQAGIPVADAEPNIAAAVRRLLTCSEPVLLVTGSLYVLGEVRPLLLAS